MTITEINVLTKEIKKRELTTAEKNEYAKNVATADDMLEELRRERNMLLKETDYLGLADVSMSDAWKKYRQDLRDITKSFKSMNDKDFKFPDKPTD
tara:strand:- start:188 stop:475 length:288 start_codon:yes stop_codon:yes gene_type:complete